MRACVRRVLTRARGYVIPDICPAIQVAWHTARIALTHERHAGSVMNHLEAAGLQIYEARHENLTVTGSLRGDDGAVRRFFLVAGRHDAGFPWGDGESLQDVLLVIGSEITGYRRYCVSQRVLEGLTLAVPATEYREDPTQGRLCYQGPLYRLLDGHETSFSEMHAGSPRLLACEAEIELAFEVAQWRTSSFPFQVTHRQVRRLDPDTRRAIEEVLPVMPALGISLTPYLVTPRGGRISLDEPGAGSTRFTLERVGCRGEAERVVLRNLREPTLLHGYLCAVQPWAGRVRVQLHTDTLRTQPEPAAGGDLDALLGALVSRAATMELTLENHGLELEQLEPEGAHNGRALMPCGEPLLAVRNDHYAVTVFERRIVPVRDPQGQTCLALEERTSLLRREALNSDREVTVAAIRDPDRFAALDAVLAATGFDAVVAGRLAASGKERAAFAIAIAPSFALAHGQADAGTYTDPALVRHLVHRLRAAGFERIAVVEEQRAHGGAFDRLGLGVRAVAEALGYTEDDGYRIVDLTEEAAEAAGARPAAPVPDSCPGAPTWRDADLRIVFAKNATHPRSYYALTLANVHGALQTSPVHFGLIDAYLSADGPAGVFADVHPNPTQTIIGGADLVAVDWVGAAKMGIDPMINTAMAMAVQSSGKPAIRLVGDGCVYRPWRNAPVVMTGVEPERLWLEKHGRLAWFLRLLVSPIREVFVVHAEQRKVARLVDRALYLIGR
jgi:hypothetical protein